MGSRYLFIIFYCWIEKRLSRGDYRRKPLPNPCNSLEQMRISLEAFGIDRFQSVYEIRNWTICS